jgi:predicted nucleic acid-binding protein
MNVVVLDAGPLGTVSNPRSSTENELCRQWLDDLVARGIRVIVPEIADYEVRRELLRARKLAGIARLDRVKAALDYLPITTEAILLAAEFWARARQQGRPPTGNKELDGDAILAAQALTCGVAASDLVIATLNVGHLDQFAPAKIWQEIS